MRRSASFDSFCWAARSSMARTFSRIWNSKSFSERGEFGFQFAGAVADLEIALAGETSALLVQGVLLLASGLVLDFKLRELVVQFVEEAGDIVLLGTKAPACGVYDSAFSPRRSAVWMPAKRRARRGAIGSWVRALLVEACGGVEHALRVGGVDLERGVVGGDKRPGARLEEVICDGDGERCALFGIGGGAKLIEQHE